MALCNFFFGQEGKSSLVTASNLSSGSGWAEIQCGLAAGDQHLVVKKIPPQLKVSYVTCQHERVRVHVKYNEVVGPCRYSSSCTSLGFLALCGPWPLRRDPF